MANNTLNTRIKHRCDTEANWISKNPILLTGECAYTSNGNNKGRYKVGDGSSKWSDLTYAMDTQLNNKSDFKHKYILSEDTGTGYYTKLFEVTTTAWANFNYEIAIAQRDNGFAYIKFYIQNNGDSYFHNVKISYKINSLCPDFIKDNLKGFIYKDEVNKCSKLEVWYHVVPWNEVKFFEKTLNDRSGKLTWMSLFSRQENFPTNATEEIVAIPESIDWTNITGKPTSYTPSTHTHSISQISDISNASVKTATSALVAVRADKLTTARNIKVSGGATSNNGANFDGSGNISIPIDSVKESYLSWGGKNFSGDFGCIDAAMVPDLGANRLAFGKPAGITIEYSRDGGETWLDYEATDGQKSAILSTGGYNFVIGKSDSTNMANEKCMLRITLDTDKIPVYTIFNKFALYVSTNGSTGCYCTIDASLESAPTTFVPFADKVKISGWSGWNIINVTNLISYGNSPSRQYGLIRFTFGCSSGNNGKYYGLQIYRIMGFGGVGWTTCSNMAKNGSIYSYDSNQNVTFPAAVVAPNFNGSLNGNARTTTVLKDSHKINGTSFNGSADITTVNWGTSRNITIGNAKKSVNGSADVSWSLNEIGAAASGHNHNNVTTSTSGFMSTNDKSNLDTLVKYFDNSVTITKNDIANIIVKAGDVFILEKIPDVV